jgi:hypothetical protein
MVRVLALWRGTEDVGQELVPLADRLAPYIDLIRISDQRNEQCGDSLCCRQCYEAHARTIILPYDLMTQDETTRYLELLQHMTIRRSATEDADAPGEA